MPAECRSAYSPSTRSGSMGSGTLRRSLSAEGYPCAKVLCSGVTGCITAQDTNSRLESQDGINAASGRAHHAPGVSHWRTNRASLPRTTCAENKDQGRAKRPCLAPSTGEYTHTAVISTSFHGRDGRWCLSRAFVPPDRIRRSQYREASKDCQDSESAARPLDRVARRF